MKSKRSQEPIFFVYEHWRPDKGRCFYVGKGYGNRAGFMSKRNRHHQNIQALLRAQGLKVEIRYLVKDVPEEEAFSVERERIRSLRESGISLVNLTEGGEGTAGLVRSAETRAKMSRAKKGSVVSEAQKIAHSLRMTGRKQSEETIRKRVEKLRGQVRDASARERMSQSRIGKPFSAEHRRKLSLSHMGHKPAPKTAEGLRRISEARKAYFAKRRSDAQPSAQLELF